MRTQYKLEVFKRDFTFQGFSPIPEPEISFDYLTLEKTIVQAYRIAADKGDYAHITDNAGNVVYQGVVDDIETNKKSTVLTLKPLLSLFDTDVFFNRTQSANIEAFILGVITAQWGTNADRLQNITGLTVAVTSTTQGKLNLKDNIHSLFEIMTKALTSYGIAVNVNLQPQAKAINVTIGKAPTPVTLEARLKGITEKSIVIGDSYGQLNKITIVNKDNETEQVSYFLHTDNTITTTDADRKTPVFFTTEFISDSDNFAEDAYARAYEALAPQQYDNLIELSAPKASGILPCNLPIGTVATIIDGSDQYNSILTGYEYTGLTAKLIFGVVRLDLTKRLILERRQSS